MSKEFHVGQPGILRMEALMRSYVYWPKMDKEVENLVKDCRECALAAKLLTIKCEPWPKVDVPWSRLHIDFADLLNGSYYLVIVSSFSNWPEICKCKKPTSSAVTIFLHELFARFGVPDATTSDNGTQFVPFEFKMFCKTFALEHVTTGLYHPSSHGQAERFVDMFKRALRKLKKEVTDEVALQFLWVYHVTPNPNAPEGYYLNYPPIHPPTHYLYYYYIP
ncbi:uncharacterized protein K02A2.6-like [Octopus bimaculoides]|uniref:uncharacterized protein K02A2.6-like n=1 Tax=Octopus bimaculoides TaxID=37653 RepID=UPI00071D6F02|nr:uncharacterized protein K02A2.6-like [Octopus bimaculoides]|eukprot:XP_014770082.1 PREDICTED: uncharacterized protein K02A2.6-like [Octopus bimaculoides]